MSDNPIALLESELATLRDMNDRQLDTINALRDELRALQARYDDALRLQNAELQGFEV